MSRNSKVVFSLWMEKATTKFDLQLDSVTPHSAMGSLLMAKLEPQEL